MAPAIENFKNAWTDPRNIVTSGPFKVAAYKPYDRLVTVRDPMYWDAANVKLDGITFYALQDNTTIMNLYKAGELDAMLNHTVPAQWLDVISPMKDFMDAPEAAIDFYLFNTTKAQPAMCAFARPSTCRLTRKLMQTGVISSR